MNFYRANFTGSMPNVKVEEGKITIRYPQRLRLLARRQRMAKIELSTAVHCEIVIRSSGTEVITALGSLDLLDLDANGAGCMFHVELPEPTLVIHIRLGRSGSEFPVRRPPGMATRVHLKGWGSGVVFDDQTASGDARLQSATHEGADRRYDFKVSGSGSMITVAAG